MINKIPYWVKTLLAAFFGFVMVLASSSPDLATNLLPIAGRSAVSSKQIQAAYSKLPLSFEANLGQTDGQVKFLSHSNGVSLYLTPTEAVLTLSKLEQKPLDVSHPHALKPQPTANGSTSMLRMQLKGANPKPQLTGLEPLRGKVNYFLGNDPKHWHTNIPTYAKVQYQQVYPGVDMVYYGNQAQLEYDFVVAPSADPNMIQLAFLGADQLEVNQQNLMLHTAVGKVQLHKPVVYQIRNGLKQEIASHYVKKGKNQVGFEISAYDRSQPLIIDPVLSYSTYLGGCCGDLGTGIAVDKVGNAYIAGSTNSTDFPTENPFQATNAQANAGGNFNTFVTKLNATGDALVYSTYLGGSNGDQSEGIAIDTMDNAYITGFTASTDFPTKNPFQAAYRGGLSDVFVTKLNATGDALVYSTYLGGSDRDVVYGIAVDRADNAYVTGYTQSTDFPTKNPFQATEAPKNGYSNAFVTKLNVTGKALVYSTYLGGINATGIAIAVDTAGNAYITGDTQSSEIPTLNPLQEALGGSADAFVTKINAKGNALVYSTYLGGSGEDEGTGIAVDRAGNAYVTGSTNSTDFPTKNPFQAAYGGGVVDAFVTKLNAKGNALVYSTYLGGSGIDEGVGIAVGKAGNAYITGLVDGTDFPTKNPFRTANDSQDAFVTKLNVTGDSLVYSTYLNGSSGINLSYGIAVDSAGNAYVTGFTASTDFPTKNPFQATGSGNTAFVTKLVQRS